MTAQIGPGVFPMLYAFFEENGALRLDPILRQVDVCLAQGVAGIAALGLGTEAAKLTEDEKELIVSETAKRIGGAAPLLVTVRGDAPGDQVSSARRALDLGATALLLQPPSTERSSAELRRFFSEVMAQLDCPVGVQNAPEFLGYGLSDSDLEGLAGDHANFSIAKLECPALALEPVATALSGKALVFNGRCGLEMPDNLRAGAAGLIPGTETIDRTARIFARFRDGQDAEADAIYGEVLPALTFIMQGVPQFLSYGKALLSLRLGVEIGGCREPWLSHTPFGLETIRRYAARLGPLQAQS